MEIRPSTLATKQSDDSLIFFTRHSLFSNHHPAEFTVKLQNFHNLQQFSAYEKVKLLGLTTVIVPVILHYLHIDHPQEWKRDVAEVPAEGIWAKFKQDPYRYLHDQLIATDHLKIGEASKNQQ